MLISRCAWHPFFRGYPRPLRVISWRGPGIAFSDTICRSCAERVRIEGLWASSPPKPVWPGSAQTALLFVGLPLLGALVLMAAPLHDAGPPPAREEAAAALVAEAALIDALPDDPAPVMPPARRSVRRPRRVENHPVPAVIWETRRELSPSHENALGGSRRPAPATTTPWLLRRVTSDPVTLAAVVARTSAAGAVSSEPQSP